MGLIRGVGEGSIDMLMSDDFSGVAVEDAILVVRHVCRVEVISGIVVFGVARSDSVSNAFVAVILM